MGVLAKPKGMRPNPPKAPPQPKYAIRHDVATCPDCRKSLPSSAKFCRRCGFRLGADYKLMTWNGGQSATIQLSKESDVQHATKRIRAEIMKSMGTAAADSRSLFGTTTFAPMATPEMIARQAPTPAPCPEFGRAHVPTHAELRARAMLTCKTRDNQDAVSALTGAYFPRADAPRIIEAVVARGGYSVAIAIALVVISIILAIIANPQLGTDILNWLEHLTWN